MSKLSEYSKFDHLVDDDDDDHDNKTNNNNNSNDSSKTGLATVSSSLSTVPAADAAAAFASVATTAAAAATTTTTNGGGATMIPHVNIPYRYCFVYNGSVVYCWEQSLTEVMVYVPLPSLPQAQRPLGKHDLKISIQSNRLSIQLHGTTRPFLDEPTRHAVDTTESTWALEEVEDSSSSLQIVIYLQKANKGLVWDSVLKGIILADASTTTGAVLDPYQLQRVQEELLRQRWQEENPGMDFRDAQFNGAAPDPRTFMGGVKYF